MKTCSRCSAEFGCGAQSGEAHCWCKDMPAVMPVAGADCLCPVCLGKEIEAKVGLCLACVHAKRLTSKSGATLFQCSLSAADSKFAKFPRLPMRSCAGYEK